MSNVELRKLRLVFREEEAYRRLLDQRGSLAQSLLDWLQQLIDGPDIPNYLRTHICKTILRLSNGSDLHPSCLTLHNVTMVGQHPVDVEGGFGDVWMGKFGTDERVVCLKVARVNMSDIKRLLKPFVREAILWRQLKHPNLLPCLGLYYLDNAKERICLVSPWMENRNLVQFLRNRPRESVNHVQLMHDIASGLSHLHALKVIHGDLKGANILITPSSRACITDFGLSRVATSQLFKVTSTKQRTGTVRWSAPELHMGNSATTKSDIYSCGCVYYEIITGRLPFHELDSDGAVLLAIITGKSPSKPDNFKDLAPTGIWSLMERCWEPEPLRPEAEDLLTNLRSIDCQIAPTEDWDDSLFTELRNNVDTSYLQHNEALTFLKTIELECHTMSFEDQLRALQRLFRDREAYRELLSQRGTVAQSLLDWLQRLNILITPSFRACIADFGLSQVLETELLKDETTPEPEDDSGYRGTVRWTAPEILEGRMATKQSDIYSCGCVFYEIITQRRPFEELRSDAAVLFAIVRGKRPNRPSDTVMPREELWSLMQNCWTHEPALRPAAGQLVTALEANSRITPAEDWDYDIYIQGHDIVDHHEQYTEALEFLETVTVVGLSRRDQTQSFGDDGEPVTQEHSDTQSEEMLAYQRTVMNEAQRLRGSALTISERDALLQKEEELYSRKVDEIRAQRESLKRETSQPQ
ncbi:hypothetical protein VNI00_010933 [Paramarasmius palmivorus]|uniref:Protein kinase domain-containing protein n=1 Tax=Paramarasmius palmivorus TaxID=297713 RepID=A0AAW0CG55_9AGAR